MLVCSPAYWVSEGSLGILLLVKKVTIGGVENLVT